MAQLSALNNKNNENSRAGRALAPLNAEEPMTTRFFALLWLLTSMVLVARADQECSILTAADVERITGAKVQNVARLSRPGAGGTCANYTTPDGRLYLGVSQLNSASDYEMAVKSVPESVYPKREKLRGVGDEAILMKDESGRLRYLVARKGNRGVVLFPLDKSPNDDQLKKLALQALSR